MSTMQATVQQFPKQAATSTYCRVYTFHPPRNSYAKAAQRPLSRYYRRWIIRFIRDLTIAALLLFPHFMFSHP